MNFFCLGATIPSTSFLTLVDMPGYGYRSRSEWGQFIIELKMVYVLIDANVGELKATDLSMLGLLKAHRKPFRVVLTKTDKVQDISAVQNAVGGALKPYTPYFTLPFFPVSKVHKYEMAELRLDILVRCGVVVENW
ncbi:GTP-binding protein [Dimargaris xerosporica]|nr:GTP-binding protein [Dimargaris xerosporica]